MNFLPSIPVSSVNLSSYGFTLLDFTGFKKFHQLNTDIKVFGSQQPETQKFWKAPALTAHQPEEQCQLHCVICHHPYSLSHKAAQRCSFTMDPRNHLNVKLIHYARRPVLLIQTKFKAGHSMNCSVALWSLKTAPDASIPECRKQPRRENCSFHDTSRHKNATYSF